MLKCELTGNVVRDAEVRTTQSGVDVCTFTVAVNDKRDREHTDYIKVTAWRKLSEICGKFVKKGMKIYVCGKPSVNTYTTSKGENRSDLCVTADDIEFLSRAESNATANDDNGYTPDPEPVSEPKQNAGFTDVTDDLSELPF